MKKTFFFISGIAVGLCTSLVAGQGAGSVAVLDTSGVYVELLTLVPGQGSGQHSSIPGAHQSGTSVPEPETWVLVSLLGCTLLVAKRSHNG